MKYTSLLMLMIFIFSCNLLSKRGNAKFESEQFEIQYSYNRDLTGFLDAPTKRWIKIKNKNSGVSKEHKLQVDIFGNTKIHILMDSTYESNKGVIFNVISIRDGEGTLDLDAKTLEKINEGYVMNPYFGNISRIATIKNDTFQLDDKSKIIYFTDGVIEFDGCHGIGSKKNENLRELAVLKIEESKNIKLGIVIRSNDLLKVLTLNNNIITFEDIETWETNNNLEVKYYFDSYGGICQKELERFKYYLEKNIGKEYISKRTKSSEENLLAEFAHEMFLHVRKNLVEEERLSSKTPFAIEEIWGSSKLKLKEN